MLKNVIFFSLLLFVVVREVQGCRKCPKGIKKVKCFVNPCRGQSCKDARCRPNYCGGCNRIWYTKGGSDVTKRCAFECPNSSDCLPGVPHTPCFINPCDGKSCNGHPNAVCCPVYCGGCHDLWFVNGLRVTCQ